MMEQKSTRLLFFASCLGLLLFGITLITLGSVAPAIQEKFSLDSAASGALFSILPVGIIAGSLIFGPFADRYGYKIIFILACAAMVGGFQGIAYAPSLSMLKICILFFGVGGGVLNGATNALVSDISAENKGANLTLLGVSFAIGSLSMPFILGSLQMKFSILLIVSVIGLLPLLFALFFLSIRFPPAKQVKGVSLSQILLLMRDPFLLLVTAFLFFQAGFESLINNWTTIFLQQKSLLETTEALYALTLYVVGMAVMRLILGGPLRKIPSKLIIMMSFAFLAAACVVLHSWEGYYGAATGLVLMGLGLAAGFPVMMGFIGSRHTEVSGTAFSIVISLALLGNVLVSYTMGIIATNYGIGHFTTLAMLMTSCMIVLSILILNKTSTK
jgi:FHS family glucose/mannose:H+ symporter-like MFS transporter